jgi:hypothetical protein
MGEGSRELEVKLHSLFISAADGGTSTPIFCTKF